MTTDNKTLADVQPGGRVRLGDQAERARFEAWAHGECLSLHRWPHNGEYSDDRSSSAWKAWQFMLSDQSPPTCREDVPTTAMIEAAIGAFFKGQQWSSIRDRDAVDVMMREKMRETLQAALSAQPSPGGQDALTALQQDYDKLLDSFNRQVEVAEKIAGRALQQDDRIEELEAALAARQPVVVDLPESLHDRVEALREVAARQPVGVSTDTLRALADRWASDRGYTGSPVDEIRALIDEPTAASQPVGELHLPPDGFYKIVFDDAEVPDESFARSGALDAALRRFEQISNKWNAHLFVRFANNTRDCTVPNATTAQAVDLERFRPAVMTALGLSSPYGLERETLNELLDLIDSQAVGNGN